MFIHRKFNNISMYVFLCNRAIVMEHSASQTTGNHQGTIKCILMYIDAFRSLGTTSVWNR